ncbi:MAG: primosomal protein N' [Haliea sp.]|nr:primosomal protein N' [Haliea sp.]
MSILRVAVTAPLRQLFDYLPPEGTDTRQIAGLRPGVRVRVPFGRRELTGILTAVVEESDSPPGALRAALEVLDREPLLNAAALSLGLWAARYYHHPPGEVLALALPPGLREGGQPQPPGTPAWRLTTRGKGLPADALSRSPRQAQALGLLQAEEAVSAARLKAEGISPAILRNLADKQLAERCTLPPVEAAPAPAAKGLALNPDQQQAFDQVLSEWGNFACHLLEGVTGSGKTEVYLQLIAHCLAQGRQALVLIPEIGLTPQTLQRFEQRFGSGIAVLHSGLAAGERLAAWDAARTGRARIVIGTRSAVFTPLREPGLIIVDEEHDSAFKQQDGFRYSARDIAVKRAQDARCCVVLGSATPSLETLHNALEGRYHHQQLPARAGAGTAPSIATIDVRCQPLDGGLSPPLVAAMTDCLSSGGQVLLFLNRRGYAPTLQCHDCGWMAQCGACDARLTVHRRQRRLRCHHCGATAPLARSCPECSSTRLLTNGLGTEQAEDSLHRQFASWPIHRVDSDSMQGRDAMQQLVTRLHTGEPCILIGTQMLTKGHHFPEVGLVAVIDADALLFSPDFRGEERMAQLLTQVAGRAGRADRPGRVLLQTHYPDHPAMRAILEQSYGEQARRLLRQRQEQGLPPWSQMLMLRSDCADPRAGEQFLARLRREVEPRLPPGCKLIGPLPAPLQRRAGKFRHQLLLNAPDRRSAQYAASQMVAAAESLPGRGGLSWSIDIDPLDLN